MARTTVEEVRKLIDTDLSDDEIQVWIDIATIVVDQIEQKGVTDTELLTTIELLWSAHLIESNVSGARRKTEITHESASVTFASGDETMDLGSLAQMLDTTGTLEDDDREQANLRSLDSRGLDQ